MKSIIKTIAAASCGVILLGGMGTSIYMNRLAFDSVAAMSEKLDKAIGMTQDVAQEDDVTIGGQYVIESTLDISDAYKSGDSSKLDDRDKEVLDIASKVLAEIIKDGMTDYEKELAVYTWMTSELQNDTGLLTVIPTTQADSDNPYGVLKHHNAVCVGYATTFRLFMQMMNIECKVVHNTMLGHSWDLTKLDGEWYHTDIYMDAETGNFANFNMNDAICGANGHEWNTSFFPAANGVKYNYAYQNKVTAKDIYEIPALVKTALENTKSALGIQFEQEITEDDALAVKTMIEYIYGTLSSTSEYSSIYVSSSWIHTENEGYILVVTLNGYADVSEPQISEEALQKINDAIMEVFGTVSPGDIYFRDADDLPYSDGIVDKTNFGGVSNVAVG